MSARIVVNLAEGVASVALDRAPDGGLWLSLWQPREAVIVKLSPASLQSLAQALATDLEETGMTDSADRETASDADLAKPPLPTDYDARSGRA